MSVDDRSTASVPREGARTPLAEAAQSTSADILAAAASDPGLTEDLALGMLKRSNLPALVLDQLSRNTTVMKSRKVRRAVVEHSVTPRHVSIPLVRHLFTFDLMQVARSPVVAADIKRAAEEALINRLGRLSHGERLSLARRASGRVAAELLRDAEPRVVRAALANSRLIESAVIKAMMRREGTEELVAAVCRDPKWSVRPEIRAALPGQAKTQPAAARESARSLPPDLAPVTPPGSHQTAPVQQGTIDDPGADGEDGGES